jgi:hypothetical protein
MKKILAIVPWLIVSLPLFCVAFLCFELYEANRHFGHIPQYLVDPDRFFKDLGFTFPDFGMYAYLLAPLLIIPGLIALFFKPIRYAGSHPLFFYAYLALSLLLYWFLILDDVTGFVGWYID